MSTATTTLDTPWQDGKRWLWLLSPALPLLALSSLLGYLATGLPLLLWGGPVLLYGLIPLADWWLGTDTTNPPEAAVPGLEDDAYYRAIVYAYIPLQYAMTALAAWMLATQALAGWDIAGLLLTCGIINGVGINTAHELGHKTNSFERWLAKLTLAPVAYGHFFVEHNRGHHKHVATPEDPASSRMGESFWAFLPRTVIGSLRSAWGIERARLQRLGHGPWHWRNDILQAYALTGLLFGALTAWLGWLVLPFLLLQAAFGASLLEVVNYLEHYGLLRQKKADGRYERCRPEHSWNSNHTVTNLFLYQLQRHSDHHAHPTRRFQALRHFDESPQLPAGYASMILLAYLPPLWFRVMDPKVVAHYEGDLTRANLDPRKRTKLLSRYPARPAPAAAEPGAPTGTAAGDPQQAADWQCPDCHYVYAQAQGCPDEGYAPGTPFAALPDSFSCPDCAVRDKPDFQPLPARAAA